MKRLLLFSIFFLNLQAIDILPKIISNPNIVYVNDDRKFDSSIIQDKNYLVNYVDPDKRELNKEMMDRLELLQLSSGSIAIINIEATWIPNVLLETLLKTNQEKHPRTIFIKDKNKELVKFWNLKDNDSNTLILNKAHEILFKKSGKLSIKDEEIIIKLLSE